ncbi:MAG: 50S ribosomal protein L21, partial [Clostridia bacterium]|nr:50S ribosomal protein L21 [Clostridia bacterium]
VEIGTPTLAGAKVEGKVVAQVKGEKIIIFKYKSKKNYHRKAGHRQQYTKVEITSIG